MAHLVSRREVVSDEHTILDGRYLLRRGVSLQGRRYQAGTVVERSAGTWRVREGSDETTITAALPHSMVLQGPFDGVSLYVLECGDDHHLSARGLLQSDFERADKFSVIGASLEPRESLVCVKFGCCFFPLEFFQW